MKTSFNYIAKHNDVGGKSNSPHEVSANSQDCNRGQLAFKRQAVPVLPPNSFRTYNVREQHFTMLRLHINEVFNTFKDQPWVRRPR